MGTSRQPYMSSGQLTKKMSFQQSDACPTMYRHPGWLVGLCVHVVEATGPLEGLDELVKLLKSEPLVKSDGAIGTGGEYQFLRARTEIKDSGVMITPDERCIGEVISSLEMDNCSLVASPAENKDDSPEEEEQLPDR